MCRQSEVANGLAQVTIAPGLWQTTQRDHRRQRAGASLRGAAADDRAATAGAGLHRAGPGGGASSPAADCRYRRFSMTGGRLSGTMICPARLAAAGDRDH